MALVSGGLAILLWLVRTYGVRIAAQALVWLGIKLTQTLVEGATEELGAEAVRQLLAANGQAIAMQDAGNEPHRSIDARVIEEILQKLRSSSSSSSDGAEPWENPYEEPARLIEQECRDWRSFDEHC